MTASEASRGPAAREIEPVLPRPEVPRGPYLIVGLARSGQAAARLLASRGQKVIGVDRASPDGAQLLGDFGVETYLDADGLELLDQIETVIKSPGVPKESPVIVAAHAAGKTVIGELELGWRMLENPFVAVTGTNGKTTTTELLAAIYREAGLAVAVAGNVGTPVCELVGAIAADATVVCEVSSFQLEDAPRFTPECGILLNIAPDHIDRHGTFEHYRDTKLAMFERQTAGQLAVFARSIGVDIPGGGFHNAVVVDPAIGDRIAMRGKHNMANAQIAEQAAIGMGVDPAAVSRALAGFKGVEHRMEPIAEIDRVSYINDSKATNVAAALAALQSFDGGAHAILGGSLKGERFTGLRDAVGRSCAAIYLIGQAAEQIADDLEGVETPVYITGTLDAAFAAAAEAAQPGDTVLLTPACASFDQFKNYEQRGNSFKQLVNQRARAGHR